MTRTTPRAAGLLSFVAGLVLCAVPGALAGGNCITDVEARAGCIEDRILERRSFTAAELEAIDLNDDGQVDVADLVCFYNQCFRRAYFETLDQTVGENDGVVTARVLFDEAVTGTVCWSWSGSATAGQDYVQLGGQQALTAATAFNIPVPILDDAVLGEIPETVVLTIEPPLPENACSGYQVGAINRHTIFIDDNDAIWRGVLETGSGKIPFTLQTLDAGAELTARITSDGFGTFPAGTWDATSATLDPGQTFTLDMAPIEMGAESSSVGVAFSRTLQLDATEQKLCLSEPGTPVCSSDDDCSVGACLLEQTVSEQLIRGHYTELVTFATMPHLNSTVTGMFTLARVIPRSLPEAELEEARRGE